MMVVESVSSPRRRSQPANLVASSSKKPVSSLEESDGWSILFQRHRFLLTMLALLAFLCVIYLYFAVTLGTTNVCTGMAGAEKSLCEAKVASLHNGKLKLF